MPKDSSRPSLPTSSSDFALPSSSVASTSSVTLDDSSFVLHRFRRPSLLAPSSTHISETRLHSPLVSSSTLQPSPTKRKAHSDDESLEDTPMYRDRPGRESSPSSSSENPTPPLAIQETSEESEDGGRVVQVKSLRTPPRKSSVDNHFIPRRRLSFPVKQPRILNLLAESRPAENEVKSEAAFQRLVAAGAEIPMQPRTPSTMSNRGRYPEEACEDDDQREETPSDDEGEDEPAYVSSMSEPIAIKNRTPAGSVNGDDLNTMSISESPSFSSISSMAMDVDIPSASPSVSSLSSTPINHWRYTPPPTTSAVRSNKRKLDDRFDPYPAASKRRAVSPSLIHLRESHSNVGSPKTRSTPRLPIAIPVAVPGSNANSATSSPTFSGSFSTSFSRSVPVAMSPTLRASMGLASPILRPLARGIRRDGEEKEVEGAGEAVGGLSLG
ncbi:hypothetical protein J3R30DRAFT_3281588 [Lentinula aciculospora]|uniref:Uncharacterized protein n=1 Tax=Lentinula aciculospora TaxID=153920 RepID=A0A9W9API3_9AGAR|nr:hypothetical protein J3R30DRAFT_3281588 [Lentinula aciculospora]